MAEITPKVRCMNCGTVQEIAVAPWLIGAWGFSTSDAEKEVLREACKTWELWLKLPNQRSDETTVVLEAVHSIQQMLALRLARRVDSETWGPE